MKSSFSLPDIIAHAKEYGFIFPSSDIYEGLATVYDYGPWGVELKNNIKAYWWKNMTQLHDQVVGIDSAIFMHPTTWKASGHIDNFSDPLIDNKDSKKRYRVDYLIEEFVQKEISKHKKEDTENRLSDLQKLPEETESLLNQGKYAEVLELIKKWKITCPVSGTDNWTDIRQFNLMFSTEMGAVADESSRLYLRPETAQGIFVNFLNVQKTTRLKVPFGIAQIGKAFRNEIVARQFTFRMREFEQMEMQFFVQPGEQKEWFEYWKKERLKWHHQLGISPDKYRFHNHSKPAHYADAATDIEYEFPFGFKEVEGIHSRTDFDLKQHQQYSKKKLMYFDTELNQSYIPYVIETSIGLDRMLLLILCNSYDKETIAQEGSPADTRVVLRIPPVLAPIKLAIFPLTKKDGLPELAKEIFSSYRQRVKCFYEEKDAIGKRYRRQDAIGTPYCITIDYQTKEDRTVTLRHRDTMKQERINIEEIEKYLT